MLVRADSHTACAALSSQTKRHVQPAKGLAKVIRNNNHLHSWLRHPDPEIMRCIHIRWMMDYAQ
jgi:hypothetical protein